MNSLFGVIAFNMAIGGNLVNRGFSNSTEINFLKMGKFYHGVSQRKEELHGGHGVQDFSV